MPERSSLGPTRGKYTPARTALKATTARYLSMAREWIEIRNTCGAEAPRPFPAFLGPVSDRTDRSE